MIPVSDQVDGIRQLRDILMSPAADKMPGPWLRDAGQMIRDHMIELHGIPSPTPGERRAGSHGAGPKQMDILAAFRLGRHLPLPRRGGGAVAQEMRDRGIPKWDIITAGGANRSGKTVATWGLCFANHLRDHAKDGQLFWAIAPDFTKLRQGPHKWLWDYLPHGMFQGRTYGDSLGFGMNPILPLQLPDDRGRIKVVFKTEEQKLESFESDSVSGICWTEAVRESIYDAILSRIVDTDGFILVDYLPTEAWHDERFSENPDVFYRHFAMMDNAHNLPPGAIDKARGRMTPDEAAVRIDGKSRSGHGVVFKEFRKDYHVLRDPDSGHLVRTFPIPRDWPKWVYTDVGKYTASLLLTLNPATGKRFVVDEAYSIALNVEENAEAIMAMLARNGLSLKDIRGGGEAPAFAMDPAAWHYTAANELHLGELYALQGLAYEPWIRTTTIGESAMITKTQYDFMHFDILVFDRCRNLIRELTTWKHKTDKDGKIDPNDRYTGDNHAVDALKAWNNSRPGLELVPLTPEDMDRAY